MSLAIYAYSKLRFLHSNAECDEDCYDAGDSIIVGCYDSELIERLDDKQPGCYATNGGQKINFEAGSYRNYNYWRALLCTIALGKTPGLVWANAQDYQGQPFFELIYMSDCEGAIGPITSAKLAADFDNFSEKCEPKLRAILTAEDLEADPAETQRYIVYWLSKYEQWHRAFTLASDDGFVIFR